MANAGPYIEGQTVTLRCEFRQGSTDALADPTTVACRLRKPDGTREALVVSRESEGVYTAAHVCDQAGTYRHRWEGTGAIPAVGESSFTVKPSEVPAI